MVRSQIHARADKRRVQAPRDCRYLEADWSMTGTEVRLLGCDPWVLAGCDGRPIPLASLLWDARP